MCGVFGVLGANKNIALKQFEKLANLSERRGQDSFGAFCVYPDQVEVPVLKGCGSAKSIIKSEIFDNFASQVSNSKSNFVSLIGHTRLATNGDWTILENNQPAIADNLIAVHNGIITNDAQLKQKFADQTYAQKELDTFSFLCLVANFLKQESNFNFARLCKKIDQEVHGSNNFVFYSFELNKVFFYSNNGSLYVGSGLNNEWYFASEKSFLQDRLHIAEKEIHQLDKGRSAYWDFNTNEIHFVSYQHEDKVKFDKISPGQKKFTQIVPNLAAHSAVNIDLRSLAKLMDSEHQRVVNETKNLNRCKRCLLPESFPGIRITQDSCSVCDSYVPQKVENNLDALDKSLGPSSDPVLVSLSGGRDSSYSMHVIAKELNRKIKAFTYDWGMVTDLARRNQSRMCGNLDVEHIIVAADIRYKRNNIRKNINAWLKSPSLGTIPLFMAGDKHYFYYAEKIKRELGYKHLVMGENKLEKTGFKTKFAGADQAGKETNMAYNLSTIGKLKMLSHYGIHFASNTGYWNSSLIDTFKGFLSYYVLPHNYTNLFNFINWEEQLVDQTLRTYDWEFSHDCATSWRIGDGTAPFYNYIYHTVAGFSENDTLRANQLREGQITLDQAKEWIDRDNHPRIDSFAWYCKVLDLDACEIAKAINKIPKHYRSK